MRRNRLLLAASVVIVGIAAFAWHRARGVVVPDDPDEVTLFSTDGRRERNPLDRDKPTDKEFLYHFPVLGRVSITDPEGHLCFFPRHVLRVVKGGRTIDLVICFQCNSYRVYADGKPASDKSPPVGKSSQDLLNKILADAGVPLAK